MTATTTRDRGWPTRYPGELRRQQREALERIDEAWTAGAHRVHVVLPPGAGKTVVGLEAARRLGRRTVVLGPNTAIQEQWAAQWRAFEGAADVPVGTDRSLATPLTSLTYQAVATFDADAEVDDDGDALGGPGAHLDRLTPQARAFVDRLAAGPEPTLVLDECHHLLQVWGELLAEILDVLPQARVLGLTATPPDALDPAEAALAARVLGPPVYVASIPAMVRDGHLAPYAELAWLCAPTAAERTWLAEEAQRFAELRTDLTDPEFAGTGFLPWLDTRVDRIGAGEWLRLERERPDLAAALLRFHHAGLAAEPLGARVREEHRHEPRADDWAVVVGEYVAEALRPSDDPRDAAALERLRQALPSIGFRLTATGLRRGRSPVDRVLARSAAKTDAAAAVVAAERRTLGDRLRALVLCDHEEATATLPARLTGVLSAEAGSARAALARLVAEPGLAGLGVALVTGRTVAGNDLALAALLRAASAAGVPLTVRPGDDGTGVLEGSWRSRQWVPLVTRTFESGEVPVLVGTRALLGEGWDARSVTTLVDLTTATTATAVVQTRGRGLRRDPEWPDKVAHTWSVVCVDHLHPRGWQDYDRFVRKHRGYLGIDGAGEVVSGVSHVDAELSPFQPPPPERFDGFDARMLVRSEDRAATRAAWRVGEPYEDVLVPLLRARGPAAGAVAGAAATAATPVAAPTTPPTTAAGASSAAAPTAAPTATAPDLLPAATGIVPAPGRTGVAPRVGVAAGWTAAVAGLVAVGALLGVVGAPAWAFLVCLLPVAGGGLAHRRAGDRAAAAYAGVVGEPGVETYAAVVADALHEADRCPQTAADVRVRVDADGAVGLDLPGPAAADFAGALEELLTAPVLPRYAVARPVLPPLPPSGRAARRTARSAFRGRLDPGVRVHAVPTGFGTNARTARAFATAWHRWVATTDPQFTGSPEGAGLLAAAGGDPPVAVETVLRTRWE